MTMEFTMCRGRIHDLSALEEQARHLVRYNRTPMHKALDRVAIGVGIWGGWHEVVISKWSLQADGHIYNAAPNDRLLRIIKCPEAPPDPAAGDVRHARVVVDRGTVSGERRDFVRIVADPDGRFEMTPDMQAELSAFRTSGSRRAGARFAISVSDRALRPRHIDSCIVRTSQERLAIELSREFSSPSGAIYHIDHAGQSHQPPVSLLVVPTGHQGSERVTVKARHGTLRFEREMSRSNWLIKLRAFVMQNGLPEENRAAGLDFLRVLGFVPGQPRAGSSTT